MHDGMRWISLKFCWGLWLKWQQIHIMLCSHERSTSSKRMEWSCRTLDGGPWQVFLSRQSQFQNWLHTESRTTKAQHVGQTFSQLLPADSWQRRLKDSMYLSSTQIYVQHCSNCKFLCGINKCKCHTCVVCVPALFPVLQDKRLWSFKTTTELTHCERGTRCIFRMPGRLPCLWHVAW